MAMIADRDRTDGHSESQFSSSDIPQEQRLISIFRRSSPSLSDEDRRSVGIAITVHALILCFLLWAGAHAMKRIVPNQQVRKILSLDSPHLQPPLLLSAAKAAGGGGGAHDIAPASAGHLPKSSPDPILPPSTPPKIPPKVAVEPTVNLQPNMRMESSLPDLGVPNGPKVSVSSLGVGGGGGVGDGLGNGVGTGRNGNAGGDTYQVGGDVSAPQVLYKADAEFSEEARKAKFQGEVLVHVVVDASGKPTQIRVIRSVGMGLDDKAREAVAQYKFRPARKNGRPVAVELNIAVNFQIF